MKYKILDRGAVNKALVNRFAYRVVSSIAGKETTPSEFDDWMINGFEGLRNLPDEKLLEYLEEFGLLEETIEEGDVSEATIADDPDYPHNREQLEVNSHDLEAMVTGLGFDLDLDIDNACFYAMGNGYPKNTTGYMAAIYDAAYEYRQKDKKMFQQVAAITKKLFSETDYDINEDPYFFVHLDESPYDPFKGGNRVEVVVGVPGVINRYRGKTIHEAFDEAYQNFVKDEAYKNFLERKK